jgi:type VI secretion system secreted protein VgrG
VAQSWAGKGWGAMFLPRIGQEVIVEFLEGDPDQPIITGCVYNAQNRPPYELPAHQTVSGFKTLSSKGGWGCNEIRFDDKKGQEQLFFQAERNHDVRVKNNAYTSVGRDTHSLVTQDQVEEIQNDHHETIARDRYVEVGRDHNLKINGKNAIEVKGSHSFTVKGDAVEVFKGNHAEETTGEVYVKGAKLILEGMSSITIQVGESYIAIDASGISIKGTNLVEVTAPSTSVQGASELTLQGGVVKIN